MATKSSQKGFIPDQSGSIRLDQRLTKQVQSDADFDNSELYSMILMVFTLLGLCGLAVAFVSGSFPWFFISFGVFLFFASGMPRKLLC